MPKTLKAILCVHNKRRGQLALVLIQKADRCFVACIRYDDGREVGTPIEKGTGLVRAELEALEQLHQQGYRPMTKGEIQVALNIC